MIGGKSSRMGGGIKSFKKFNNKYIFDRIFEKISIQTDNIIININKDKNLLYAYKKPIFEDNIKGHLGPLAGIHAAMLYIEKKMPAINWLITVPGDTPFIPNNLIERLYKSARKNNKKIVMAESNYKVHPTIGIWNIQLLKSLEKSLKNGERKIILWAKKHELGYENFKQNHYDPFFNVNYEADLSLAEEIEDKINFIKNGDNNKS